MVSKIIIGLCATLIVIIMLDRYQNYHVLKFYFKTYINTKSIKRKGVKMLMFHDYLGRFNKSYGRDEFPMRFALFKENLKKIRKLNRGHGSKTPTFGLTKFSDWTREELDSILTHHQYNGRGCEDLALSCDKHVFRDFLPKSRRAGKILPRLDWREKGAVGPIQDQKRCSACWAFSIIGIIESMSFIKHGIFTSLSIQELIDCSYHTDQTGCSSGRPLVEALEYICKTKMGIATEKDYPLTFAVKPLSDCSAAPTGILKMKSFVNSCMMKDNETRLLEVLNYGPVTALVNGDYLFNYNQGIITENCECSIDQLNHAVQIVGYDMTGPDHYYIIRNSWGTGWGKGGYARLGFGSNQCGISYSIGYLEVN